MINFFAPEGAFGRSDLDSLLDTILRDIAEKASTDPDGEWATKYGTEYENDTFMMHPFCWCEKPDCPWCNECVCETVEECIEKCTNKEYAPHFHYKPLDFKVHWYKYIGRSVETNKLLNEGQLKEMFQICIASIQTNS